MKKMIFVLSLIILCNGCFFTQTKTLKCTSISNIGEVEISKTYRFTYKKDIIDKVSLKIEFRGDKDNVSKIYEIYLKEYQQIKKQNKEIILNYNKDDNLIELDMTVDKKDKSVLDTLNLSFLQDSSFDELKNNLESTEYKCK